MIGRLPRPTLGEALLLATLAVVLVEACLGPRAPAPAGDELDQLRTALDLAEQGEPLARLGCAALPEPRRGYCLERLDGASEVVRVGRPLLDAAAQCRAQADVECVASSLETARELLRKLRSLQGSPSPSSSSSASAAPAASSAPERTP